MSRRAVEDIDAPLDAGVDVVDDSRPAELLRSVDCIVASTRTAHEAASRRDALVHLDTAGGDDSRRRACRGRLRLPEPRRSPVMSPMKSVVSRSLEVHEVGAVHHLSSEVPCASRFTPVSSTATRTSG